MIYLNEKHSVKRPARKVNDRILILCGGDTEKFYFDNFKSRVAKINVETALEADSPLNLVNLAISKVSDGYLQIWVVFDKDEFKCFDDAIKLAEKNGVHIAYSNQAFELWFILHFHRLEGGFHRDIYEHELNKLLKRTEKNKLVKPYRDIYGILKSRMDTAITNATYGHQKHNRDNSNMPISGWESSTTVYQLVKLLKSIQ